MHEEMDFMTQEGLAFFAKINASISHELKNIMANISETTGLLSDLAELATQGNELDHRVVSDSSRSILEEIQRGYATIKHMNVFAHSADEPLKEVFLYEVLKLVLNLVRCMAFARDVSIDLPEPGRLKIQTHPFFFEYLLYHGFEYAFKSVGPGEAIKVSSASQDGRVHVVYSGLGLSEYAAFPTENLLTVARSIGVEIRLDRTAGELRMVLQQASQ